MVDKNDSGEGRAPKRADGAPWRNFYGRRKGKQLRPGQAEHLATTLQDLRLAKVSWAENPDRRLLDLAEVFGNTRPVWLEVGFGGGEHLLAQAERYAEINFIGCEPFINGQAMLVPRIAEKGLTNIRIHPGDARDLLDVLPKAVLGRAFLLYPDPWPKKRHHRRRFVERETLAPLIDALAPGAHLRVATDIEDYVRHTLETAAALPDLRWTAERPGDWREPWEDWVRTRYEAKALREARKPHYLTFEKLQETKVSPQRDNHPAKAHRAD